MILAISKAGQSSSMGSSCKNNLQKNWGNNTGIINDFPDSFTKPPVGFGAKGNIKSPKSFWQKVGDVVDSIIDPKLTPEEKKRAQEWQDKINKNPFGHCR